jgi:murein L,D-transpeptidase YafK
MRPALRQLSRAAFALCAALILLAQAHATPVPPSNIGDPAADRAVRKQAAAQGKLPLPGTPDLTRLEERLAKKGLPEDSATLIRIFKAESELEVWMSRGAGARYTLFATYPICYWSGTLGPKLREGDRQAPEGFYTVTLPQAHPGGRRWPQAINIGFPNPFDRVHARSGSHILIHGGCASIGCFAMTNAVNIEVHKLTVRALDAGQSYVPVHVFPFRMTEENLARYETPAWHDFWRNLKEGYDLFERIRLPPRTSVCGRRYDFAETDVIEGANPAPIAVCPRTASLIAELAEVTSRVAEQKGPLPLESKAAFALTAYLGWPRQPNLTKQEPNSEQRIASESLRPLPCSLALPSCRKYAALRESIAYNASTAVEPRNVRKHWKAKHRKKKRWRKKRRRH